MRLGVDKLASLKGVVWRECTLMEPVRRNTLGYELSARATATSEQ
jgi:hypothetical protein